VILSAGLTPSWQQVLVFESFRPGEVNRAKAVYWYTAGKVSNAGNAAHHLGGPSLTLTVAGGAPLAEMAREFVQLGIPARWIETESATRVCTTIVDEATGTLTELVEEGRSLKPAELDAFRAAYREEAAKASVAIITGSLPRGTPPTFYRELMEMTPCPVVADFRGAGLEGVLDLRPLVVKPNREELGHTAGHPLENDRELVEAMRVLNRRGAQWVVITQGAGPVWLSGTPGVFRLFPPPVERPVNPIGCGDSMAAGIAWAIRDGREMIDAVKLGIAAAGEKLTRMYPGRQDPAEVRTRAERVRVERA
jgi:1-phosphofructokinase family hexose kinase